MQKSARATNSNSTTPLWLIMICAGTIVGMAMGLRQVMGLYLAPVSSELGIGRQPFSDSMALANLVWGIGAVLTGMIADKYGAARVIVVGALATLAGLYYLFSATNEFDLTISGLLLGIGISGTGITALVGAVGRAAAPEHRTKAIASLGMAGGIGGMLAFPYAHLLIEMLGWKSSLMVLAVTGVAMIPLAWPLRGRPIATGADRSQSLFQALVEAFAHPGFWLLTSGFFVCGFHVAFYQVHLPAFVVDQGMAASVGVASLTLIGVANILGTYLAGQSTGIMEKRVGLSLIYLARVFIFLGLLFLPITPTTVIALSGLLGLFWLSTVPLTSGLVATFFGTGWMSMLFGIVFLSHQLGSFAGLRLAGALYDQTQSYDMMWWICAGLGLFAALIHWPIKERPVARLAGEQQSV